jgi:hypothetical protein
VGRPERSSRKPRAESRPGKVHGAMVGHVVGAFIKQHPAFATNPLGDWQELVGESTARYCQPQSLKKKVLTVTAHDSVWKYHLELLKESLLAKINRGHAESLVEKIVVRVGELRATVPPLNPSLQHPDQSGSAKPFRIKKKKAPIRSLTPEEKIMLKTLEDPELRAIGTRLLKRIPIGNDE